MRWSVLNEKKAPDYPTRKAISARLISAHQQRLVEISMGALFADTNIGLYGEHVKEKVQYIVISYDTSHTYCILCLVQGLYRGRLP